MRVPEVSLGEVAEVIMGQSPDGAEYNSDGIGLPLITGSGQFGDKYPKPTQYSRSGAKTSRTDDILITIRASIGDLNWSDRSYYLGRGVAAIRVGSRLDANYAWHLLASRRRALESKGTGSTFKQIRREDIADVRMPLPALQHQHRLAALFDAVDKLRTRRRESILRLHALRQSLFLEMFGDPSTNIKRWLAKPLAEICKMYSGGTPSTSKEEFWNGSLPWFSAKDLKADDLFDSHDHVSDSVPATTNLRLLPPNTVVVVVRGMILAHTFPVSILRVPATINQDLKALLPQIPIEPQFLATALRCLSGALLKRVSDAGHGTKRLDTDRLNSLPLIVPPIKCQQAFAERISAIERLQQQMLASLSKLDELYASLQHRAFRGEL